MDILSKAVNRVGTAAGQAVAAAAQQRQIEAENRTLAELRAQARALRAQIGEEMYKLWQAGNLPPSSLDALFAAVDRSAAAITAQRALIDRLMADSGFGPAPGDGVMIDQALAPPPVPAAPTRRLATRVSPSADVCPTCGAPDMGGSRYCGDCGTRLI